MDFPNRQELFRVARDKVLQLEGRITRESIERPGTDANIITSTMVALAEECIGFLIDVAAGQNLTSAVNETLSRLVFDRYNILKKDAAPALVTVEFSTSVVNPTDFPIPQNTVVSTPAGIQFVTTLETTFPAGVTGPIFVPARSVQAGADQQINIGDITSIVGVIPGAPSDLVVTNSVASSGAADEETDESLRDRGRRFFTTVQKGTIAALEAGALAVPGVNKATVIESLDSLGRPNRFVQLIVADRFTEALAAVGVDDPSFPAQSQQLAIQVFNSLGNTRAAGIFVQVIVSQVILQPVQLQLTFTAGVQADEVALRARALITNFINQLQPGQQFIPSEAVKALRSITGLIITENEILSPAGTITPNSVQVLRTTLGLVTAVAVQTSQPIALTTNPDAFISSGITSF